MNIEKSRAIGNHVMLEEVEMDSGKVVDGIVIPDVCEGNTKQYIVRKYGTGEFDDNGELIPFDIEIGDRVIISTEKPATTLKMDGVKVLIVNQNQIIAKVIDNE